MGEGSLKPLPNYGGNMGNMDESYLWLIQRAFNYAMYIAHENWVTTNEC
jgi:hypothetical protein